VHNFTVWLLTRSYAICYTGYRLGYTKQSQAVSSFITTYKQDKARAKTMTLTGITKKGLFLTAEEGKTTLRVFENEKGYQEWKISTDKGGHTMLTFYKIKTLITQYTPMTQELFNNYLETN